MNKLHAEFSLFCESQSASLVLIAFGANVAVDIIMRTRPRMYTIKSNGVSFRIGLIFEPDVSFGGIRQLVVFADHPEFLIHSGDAQTLAKMDAAIDAAFVLAGETAEWGYFSTYAGEMKYREYWGVLRMAMRERQKEQETGPLLHFKDVPPEIVAYLTCQGWTVNELLVVSDSLRGLALSAMGKAGYLGQKASNGTVGGSKDSGGTRVRNYTSLGYSQPAASASQPTASASQPAASVSNPDSVLPENGSSTTRNVVHVADSVAAEKEDDMSTSAFRTISHRDVLRAVSVNPYLHTALPSIVGIVVRCAGCGRGEIFDSSPTYLSLPPLKGYYVAQRKSRCKSESCLGQQMLFVPLDASTQYVSHKEISSVMKGSPTLTRKLVAMVIDGDETIELTAEEKRRSVKFNRKI